MRPIITIAVVLLCMGTIGPCVMCEENTVTDEAVKVVDAKNLTCPICDDAIPETGADKVEYKDKSYNLCCEPCVRHFKQFPDKFIKMLEKQ